MQGTGKAVPRGKFLVTQASLRTQEKSLNSVIQGSRHSQSNCCQNTNGNLAELEQIILKFVWKYKRPHMAKAVLRKYKTRGISSSRFHTVLQSYCNPTTMILAQTDT